MDEATVSTHSKPNRDVHFHGLPWSQRIAMAVVSILFPYLLVIGVSAGLPGAVTYVIVTGVGAAVFCAVFLVSYRMSARFQVALVSAALASVLVFAMFLRIFHVWLLVFYLSVLLAIAYRFTRMLQTTSIAYLNYAAFRMESMITILFTFFFVFLANQIEDANQSIHHFYIAIYLVLIVMRVYLLWRFDRVTSGPNYKSSGLAIAIWGIVFLSVLATFIRLASSFYMAFVGLFLRLIKPLLKFLFSFVHPLTNRHLISAVKSPFKPAKQIPPTVRHHLSAMATNLLLVGIIVVAILLSLYVFSKLYKAQMNKDGVKVPGVENDLVRRTWLQSNTEIRFVATSDQERLQYQRFLRTLIRKKVRLSRFETAVALANRVADIDATAHHVTEKYRFARYKLKSENKDSDV